jgi:hypothetical protein
MHHRYAFILGILSSACALDSADNPGDELGETEQDVNSFNGTSLNGTSLNGTSLNGTSLNGTSLNGTSLNGTSLNGTSISANSTTGTPLSGTAMVGSKWTGTAANGATVNLRVDTALQGTATNNDLWFYGVSYQTTTGWSPLCGLDGASVPIKAVTVAGVWSAVSGDSALYSTSSTKFTFACRGKTVAKCIELGYKTFKGKTNQMVTCVRLLRGDYCGNGNAYTVDGTLLNLFDNVGVQADTQAWHREAEWTMTGAKCVNSGTSARYDLQAGKDPKCVNKVVKTTSCAASFTTGPLTATLLIDELP